MMQREKQNLAHDTAMTLIGLVTENSTIEGVMTCSLI
jgi:hypothetical protein